MALLTTDELKRILTAVAGRPEGIEPGTDIADVPFTELGYDSLALMETASRAEREFGVSIPVEAIGELATIRMFAEFVNSGTAPEVPVESFFRILLRLRIRQGAEQEFEQAWIDVGTAVTGHPGNLAQWLLRGTGEDDQYYYIVSDWVDEPSFREFERSEQHRAHRAVLHPFREEGSMSTMRCVHHLRGAASGNASS